MEAIVIGILVALVVFLTIFYEIPEMKEATAKIESLQKDLDTKTQHYEWLEEITDSLLGKNSEEWLKEFERFQDQREINPNM